MQLSLQGREGLLKDYSGLSSHFPQAFLPGLESASKARGLGWRAPVRLCQGRCRRARAELGTVLARRGNGLHTRPGTKPCSILLGPRCELHSGRGTPPPHTHTPTPLSQATSSTGGKGVRRGPGGRRTKRPRVGTWGVCKAGG